MSAVIGMIIFSVFMRAFLFEIKLGQVREWLEKKNKLVGIFLECSFCNGFWVGLATYMLFTLLGAVPWMWGLGDVNYWLYAVYCAVGSGSLSYYVNYYFFVVDQT